MTTNQALDLDEVFNIIADIKALRDRDPSDMIPEWLNNQPWFRVAVCQQYLRQIKRRPEPLPPGVKALRDLIKRDIRKYVKLMKADQHQPKTLCEVLSEEDTSLH